MLFSALPPAHWAILGTSASLPAAWGQPCCSAPWDGLVSSTASALVLFHLLLMMTPKDWKEAASAFLVGHWHTGELSLFSSIRCLWPKPCPLPGRWQGRGAGGSLWQQMLEHVGQCIVCAARAAARDTWRLYRANCALHMESVFILLEELSQTNLQQGCIHFCMQDSTAVMSRAQHSILSNCL